MRHKCLASFIVFVLYLTISIFIGLAQVRMIANAQFINKILAASDIYNQLPQITQSIFSSKTNNANLTEQPKEASLESKIIVKLISQSIDGQDLKSQVEKNSQAFFAYLNDESESINVVFDLKKFKSNLVKNSQTFLPEIISDQVSQLPICSGDIQPTEGELPDCKPSTVTEDQYSKELVSLVNINELIKEIPDTYDLNSAVKNPDKVFGPYKLGFKLIKYGFWLSLGLSIILLGLLVLLARNYWPAMLRWPGAALAIPAGSIFIMDLIWKVTKQSIQNNLNPGNLPQEMINSFVPVIKLIDQQTLVPGLIISGSIFGLGAILIILSCAIPHPPEPKSPAKTNPPTNLQQQPSLPAPAQPKPSSPARV